jgi:hypothetical protein
MLSAIGKGHEWAEHRGFLGQLRYSSWYYIDGYVAYTFVPPIKCTPPKGILMGTVDLGGYMPT